MRADWNRRAKEDAHYYVAFGRHGQDEEEFQATAYEVVYGLEYEFKRFPPGDWRARRALEIGCGPGRLLKPLSRHFGEIHGVDVSDEMVGLARERLRGIPHAHAHVSAGADLAQFASESFDFVYSYAGVSAHPEPRCGGLVSERSPPCAQDWRVVLVSGENGLPGADAPADTWSGVRYRPEEIVAFANENDFQMHTLEGVNTQYMWTSLRKRPAGWFQSLPQRATSNARIRRISNPHGTEPGVPCAGRFACASLWIENLPAECGLNHVQVRIGDRYGTPNYIAAPLPSGEQQLNVLLPEGIATGLVPVNLEWCGQPVGAPAIMRVVPPSPQVPRLLNVSDATDLLSGTRISSRDIKVFLEELNRPEDATFRSTRASSHR